MWMMGYNDGGELNLHDAFNSTTRKLRPLISRPLPSTNNSPASNPPCLSRIHASADFFSQYQHLATVAEQNKREFNASPQVVVSSRWNPTPEQLRALEELYRRGTRTPSAEQIQHITAQLRSYGKIEGKNVFYWFQNHKARERQKRRRQMESASDDRDLDMSEKNKELGVGRTVFEVEQTKNWAPPTNCSTLAEESHVSIQRAAAAKAVVAQAAESCMRTDGRIQLGERELNLQHRRNNIVERNATWQMMQLSCPHPHTFPTNLINTSASITTTTTSRTTSSVISSTMDKRLIKTSTQDHTTVNSDEEAYNNCSAEESQTLELFPLRSGDYNGSDKDTHEQISVSAINLGIMTTSSQFFEFLPLKN